MKLKLVWKLCLMLPLAASARTLSTSVTVVVKEPNGNRDVHATYNANFAMAAHTIQLPVFSGSGQVIHPFVYVGQATDSFQNLAITLPDNNQIAPSGTQRKFSICANGGTSCFVPTITIAGAPQDITATLQPAAALGAVGLNQNVKTPNSTRFADQFPGGDAGARINAAIADLPATGGWVIACGFQSAASAAVTITVNKPVKLTLCGSTLTLNGSPGIASTSQFTIEGLGTGMDAVGTRILLGAANLVGIQHNAPQALTVRNISFDSTAGVQTSGAAVSLDGASPGSTVTNLGLVENCRFFNQWIGIRSIGSIQARYIFNAFALTQSVGISINNTQNAGDNGDNLIEGNFFQTGVTTARAIDFQAGGGLRIIGNKFYNHLYALNFRMANAINTSQLSILGNHFETMTNGAIRIESQTASATFGYVTITGNYFGSGGVEIIAIVPTAGATISNVSITGNSMTQTGTGKAIHIGAGVGNVIVTGNAISGPGATSTGVQIDTGAVQPLVVGPNSFDQVMTPESFPAAMRVDGVHFAPNAVSTNVAFDNVPTSVRTSYITLPNNTYIGQVNAAGNANWKVLGLDGSNVLQIGQSVPLTQINSALQVAGQSVGLALTHQFVAGTSPNQTTLNFPAPAGNVTLRFPNTADTMVGRATTDALTNKGFARLNVTLVKGANVDVPIATNNFVKITGPTGVFSVGGFVNGTDGRVLYLYNSVAFAITIKNEDAAETTAANRIITLTGTDVTLRAGTSFAAFIYDSAARRWLLTATN